MDGIHDVGGMHGFGPIRIERDEPVFHAGWERTVFGLMVGVSARGLFNVDAFRHGIETLPPADYLRASYYARWLWSIEKLAVAAGLVTPVEVAIRVESLRRAARPSPAGGGPPSAPPTGAVGAVGFLRQIRQTPRFRAGDRVRARNQHPPGHTRLPRYVRGRVGEVTRVYPACVFPDTHAHRLGEDPQYVYNVRFDAGELWGPDAEPASSVSVDCFESYLELA